MEDKTISVFELKQILVEMMSFIHVFCEKEGIKYSLAYGTLLGAVRHKGFIPWDDDIDILMLRPDYEKFLKLFNKSGDGTYSVASYETDSQFRYTLAKVVDNRTINNELGYNKYGIGIDLFPIDKIPNNISVAKNIFRRHEFFWKLFALKNMKWDKKRSLLKNIFMAFSKSILAAIPFSLLHRMINNSATRNSHLKDNYSLGCLFAPYGIKNMMPKEVFSEVIYMTFEHHSFWGLKDYDAYLHNLYGNYMRLPPVEKRVSTHSFDAYWK